jgi:hypothetical protein
VPAGFREPYAVGRTYPWLRGDFRAWLDALRGRRVDSVSLCAWALRMVGMTLRSHHLTFEWRDPLPTLDMYWQQFAKPALRRLARPGQRKPAPAVRPGRA